MFRVHCSVLARRPGGVSLFRGAAFTLLAVTVSVALATVLAAPLAAFDKNSKTQEKRDDAKVRDARKDVDQARDKLNDAQKDLAKALKDEQAAEAREKAALKAIEAARDKVEVRLGKAVGLEAALAAQKEAQTAFDKVKKPVIESLHTSSAFQAAEKDADAAKSELRALLANKDLSDEQRKAKSADCNRRALSPGKLESAALDGDAEASSARARLKETQEKVAALREKIRGEVDSDAAVKQARADSTEAARDAKRKNEASAKLRREVANAQGKLNQEQAQLQKAQAQDKKNDGKKK